MTAIPDISLSKNILAMSLVTEGETFNGGINL
jgi:hypothetical protein